MDVLITENRTTNYRKCNRQFVTPNEKKSEEQSAIIKKILLERTSLRGICRVMGISLTWLLKFFTIVTDSIPDDLGIKVTDSIPDDLGIKKTEKEQAYPN
ncbi:MAG: hypothetical protein GY874_17040 [Desulfobacteraceae bacterium]|nr:hypothetical protein [Desulfobacteraceae bacterium]